MNRKYGLLVLIGFLGAALLACEVQAQPQGGRGGPGGRGGMMGRGGTAMLLPLLNNEKVQKELELVDDQKTKISTLAEDQRNAMRESFSALQGLSGEERATKMQELARENQEKLMKKLGEILLPNQLERLKQIQVQAEGAMAFSNPDVVKALGLTTEQQDKIRTISQEAMAQRREAMQNLSPEERQAKTRELNKELLDKLVGVLTQEQKDKYEKLKGAAVDIDFSTLMGRGGMGGARGGRRGGGGGGGGG
jgi:uncharacterized protein (DUF2384 family)